MFFNKSFKKITVSILVSVVLLLSVNATAIAKHGDLISWFNPIKSIKKEEKSIKIPANLENTMKEAITEIYGQDKVDEIYENIKEIAQESVNNRSDILKNQDMLRSSDWYKDEIIYMFYVDQFGVHANNKKNSFNETIEMLPYLKDLGVTTLYMLPFADSPMGDAGFDVRDPKKVREDLGGVKEFKKFVSAAREQGFKIKADLILNHFSDQHEWFQKAMKGDLEKINYFVSLKNPPVYDRYRDKQKGVVIKYKEQTGETSLRRLIFPDICENHYRKVNIKGDDYYFYHTFYPFQLDINWENPNVLYYVLDVMSYWSNIGIDIYRLDAIPFFMKDAGTDGENLPGTHQVLKLLSAYLQATAPRSVLQAEACQWPKDVVHYFGEQRNVNINDKKKLVRTDEMQIAYNFPYMPAIWATMLTENNKHFINAYNNTPQIPNTATWGLFLRVHDELTLEMVDIPTRKLIYKKLINKGAQFREGLGVSGRMTEFLDKDPDRIGLAFSVLLSLPGIPIIYYGDEIGALNNFKYAHDFAKQREEDQKAKNVDLEVRSFFDSRDINRGPIAKKDFYNAMENNSGFSSEVYNKVKSLISARKLSDVMRRGEIKLLKTSKSDVFAFLRETKSDKVVVLNNLTAEENWIKVYLPQSDIDNIDNSKLTDLISQRNVKIWKKSNHITVKLNPYESFWLKL